MEKRLLLTATAATVAAFAAASALAQTPGPALATFAVGPATVTASALTPNLDTVWELLWGPDNFLWMTERYGRISRVNPATGAVLPLLTLPDVTETGESGLLGMALHPDFGTSPYVYVVYNYTDAGTLKEKLVRLTYSAASQTLGAPLVLLGNIGAASTHSGSRLCILADRTLLMTTGDAQQASEAQNPASLNGKTLRLNLDGTVPATNPTPGSYVYSRGHRNAQGLLQLVNGRVYSSEHGPGTNDEVNRIEAGRNYGWPNVEGYCDLPNEQVFCAANNVREPLSTWTPTIAPAGLAYYNHPAIAGWRGSLLLVALGGRKLVQLPLDAATGNVAAGRTDFVAGTFGRLRSVCVSPQGRVYVGTSNRDGRATPAATDDRILVLENRAYAPSATRAGALGGVELWPNPAHHAVRVRLPAPATLVLRDALGRPVRTLAAAAGTAALPLDGLAPGVYVLQIAAATGTATRRLVVD